MEICIHVLGDEDLAHNLETRLPDAYQLHASTGAWPSLIIADLSKPPIREEAEAFYASLSGPRPFLLVVAEEADAATLQAAVALAADTYLPRPVDLAEFVVQVMALTLVQLVRTIWVPETARAYFRIGSKMPALQEADLLLDLFHQALGVVCYMQSLVGRSCLVTKGPIAGRNSLHLDNVFREIEGETIGEKQFAFRRQFKPKNPPLSGRLISQELIHDGRFRLKWAFLQGDEAPPDYGSALTAGVARFVKPALSAALEEFARLCTYWDQGRLDCFGASSSGLIQELDRLQGLLEKPDGLRQAALALEDLTNVINYRVEYCEEIQLLDAAPPAATIDDGRLDLHALWLQDEPIQGGDLDQHICAIPTLPALADFLSEVFRMIRILSKQRGRPPRLKIMAFQLASDLNIQIISELYTTRPERDAWFSGFARESPALQLFETRLTLERLGVLVHDISADHYGQTRLDIRVPLGLPVALDEEMDTEDER